MSTTLLKKETLERKWYVIDAAGKPLGRTAVAAANILRGKHKVDFTPNVDCGDFVIIINSDKAVLTGKKLEQNSLVSVDDDNEITAIDVGGEISLVLAAQDVCSDNSGTAQGLASCIDDVPLALQGLLLQQSSGHYAFLQNR